MRERTLQLVAMAALAALCGCYAATRVSSNRYYMKDGYRVEGPHGRFRHFEEDRKDEMVIDYGFQEKVLIDEGCDGQVDTVKFKEEEYYRSDDGSGDLFCRADEDFSFYYRMMQIPDVHEKWSHWNVSGFANQGGYFKR